MEGQLRKGEESNKFKDHMSTVCALCAHCVWKGLALPGGEAVLTLWHQRGMLLKAPFTRFLFLSVLFYPKNIAGSISPVFYLFYFGLLECARVDGNKITAVVFQAGV